MGQLAIRGNTQIMAGTIFDAQIAASAAIATSKLADGSKFVKTDGTMTYTANQSMGGYKITNLADPTTATDAVNKQYVDNLTGSGLSIKNAVAFTTTGNITLSGLGTQAGGDWGASLTVGQRVLVKNQTTPSQNGIYVASSTAWSRASDFNSAVNVIANSFMFVESGTALNDTGWVLTTDPPYTIDTTALNFAQFSAAGVVTAGNGLSQVGNQFNVNVGNGIQITGNNVAVKLADSTLTSTASGLALASLTAGYLLVGNGGNIATGVAMSGDATITSTGSVTVAATIQRTAGFVDEETPSGLINGTNTSFSLANTPVAGSVKLFVNGIRQKYGAGNDFTVSGNTITMAWAPSNAGTSPDTLVVEYRK